MRPEARLRGIAVTLALAAACKKTPPPVDFRSRVDVAPAPAADAGRDAGAAFRAREGTPVNGDGRTVTLAGRSVSAPPGQRFVESIPWDYDRDGTDEALFVARVTDAGDAAGVSLVRPLPDALEFSDVCGNEPEDRSCGVPHLRQTSPRSLVVSWRCPQARPEGVDGEPRGLFAAEAVLIGLHQNEMSFRARAGILRGELPDTALDLSVEGTDTDGDGVDELVVHVAAGRPNAAPGARARLVYFSRPQGYVWDTQEPGASLRALIDAQRRRAGSRRTAAGVVPAMEDLLRLRRALCQGSALARFRLAGNVGVRCAPDPFEGAAETLLRAYVSLGELPAAWAMTRAASAHPLGIVPIERVRSLLEGASRAERNVTATLGPVAPRPLEPVPLLRHPVARWENPREPASIVLRGDHASRVRRADWAVTDAPDLSSAGAAQVLPTDLARTRRITGFTWTFEGLAAVMCPVDDDACEAAWRERGGAIPETAERRRVAMLPPADVPPPSNPTPYASPYTSPDLRVLGWGPEGLVVALRGRVWRIPPAGDAVPLAAASRWTGTYPEGQAITEDGRVAVLPAPEGIWVHEDTAWHRLAPDALRDRLARVRDVSPSADGRTLVAWMDDNSLAVITRAARR